MQATIYIEQHERFEAIEAYADRLNEDQINSIHEAPETALIRLDIHGDKTEIMIIEEG